MEWLSDKKVSVIIVTGGAKDYLNSCMDSLKKQTHPVTEIIVIDNSFNSNLSREIIKRYPDAKLYSSSTNLPYCDALNKGIRMGRGCFILCLNDDVILDGSFIERALRGFEINEKIGMVSGKILRSGGKTIDTTGLFLSIWRTAKERGYGRKDKRQYEKEGYIFGVNGAVAFYLRKMLEDIKIDSDYFDTDFRFFYEDLDTAWRAQNLGWKAYYIPSAIAYHVRGGTARPDSGIDRPYARRYLSDDLHSDLIKNRHLTIIKNEPFFNFLLHLPFIILYDMFMWSYVLFFRPNLIGRSFSNLKYLKSAFRKRIIIKEKHKLQDEHKG